MCIDARGFCIAWSIYALEFAQTPALKYGDLRFIEYKI
jgi:hypothetical protein